MKQRSALEKMTKAVLMELAKEGNLPGRSTMNKDTLIEALSLRKNRNAGKKGGASRKTSASSQVRTPGTKAQSKRNTPSPINPRNESVLRSGIEFKVRKRVGSPPQTLQEEVERGRYDLGVEQGALLQSSAVSEELPTGYGDERIVLLVRDPYWIYTYWEVQEETVNRALAEHNLSGRYPQKVLRVYLGEEADYQDIEVEGLINNWYINVGRPNAELFVDLGIRVEGRFITLVRSNRVRTPRAGMSEVVDEQWMTMEEEAREIYALSGGGRLGEGSLGLQEMMEKRLWGEISSGAISSFFGSGRFRERERGFWYNLDAELIVYGATEPNARVTLQGRPIRLRPDGTFTARFALPDGDQEIPVTFVSFDEVDRATVTPKVVRETKRS